VQRTILLPSSISAATAFELLIDLSFHAFLTLSLSPKEQILKVDVSSGLEAPLLNKRIQTLALTQF
jgi:hypothetical protein